MDDVIEAKLYFYIYGLLSTEKNKILNALQCPEHFEANVQSFGPQKKYTNSDIFWRMIFNYGETSNSGSTYMETGYIDIEKRVRECIADILKQSGIIVNDLTVYVYFWFENWALSDRDPPVGARVEFMFDTPRLDLPEPETEGGYESWMM